MGIFSLAFEKLKYSEEHPKELQDIDILQKLLDELLQESLGVFFFFEKKNPCKNFLMYFWRSCYSNLVNFREKFLMVFNEAPWTNFCEELLEQLSEKLFGGPFLKLSGEPWGILDKLLDKLLQRNSLNENIGRTPRRKSLEKKNPSRNFLMYFWSCFCNNSRDRRDPYRIRRSIVAPWTNFCTNLWRVPGRIAETIK